VTITENYIPVSQYLLNFMKEIENIPPIELEKLSKKCGTASLKMINNGSRFSRWLDGQYLVRQNFEVSFRTSGNDTKARCKAFSFLEQLKRLFNSVTYIYLGENRTFVQIFPTDTPIMSVRCTGGEEEYTAVYQLVYLENN